MTHSSYRDWSNWLWSTSSLHWFDHHSALCWQLKSWNCKCLWTGKYKILKSKNTEYTEKYCGQLKSWNCRCLWTGKSAQVSKTLNVGWFLELRIISKCIGEVFFLQIYIDLNINCFPTACLFCPNFLACSWFIMFVVPISSA